jgi:hypothetical protein
VNTYGHHQPLTALAESERSVTVVTGDSGTGKSRLLAVAQDAARDRVTAAPAPVPLRRSAGSLQAALVDALAAAAAESAQDPAVARRVGQRVIAAAAAAGTGAAANLVKAVGKELVAAVKARVGPEAGAALAEFAAGLATAPADEIAARLRTARVDGALETITALAEDVAGAVGSRLVIALDDGDLLPEEDVRLLSDLADYGTAALRVRVAWSTADPEQDRRVRMLTDAGAARVELTGLSQQAVSAWLDAEGLPDALAEPVHRISGGYPLLVEGIAGHLLAGGCLDDFAADARHGELVGRLLESALDGLGMDAALAARRLSVFYDPPPDERAAAYLHLDATAWAETQRRLVAARVLSSIVNGRPWFHEQRRRHLWDRVVTPQERGPIADAAVAELVEQLRQTGNPALPAAIARTARHATGPDTAHPAVAAALAADADELAVAGALTELADHATGNPAVLGDNLLLHARDTYRTDGDLIDALGRLERRGLVHVAAGEQATAVAATWGTPLAAVVIAGRSADELNRLPVPAAASRVFEAVIRPLVSPFQEMVYGIGDPDLDALARHARDLRGDPTAPIPMRGWPALLLRARYGETPLYAAVTYRTEQERDSARARVTGLDHEHLGRPVRVDDALAHPAATIPSLRWVRAAALVARADVLSAGKAKLAADPPVDSAEHARRRIDTLRVIRARTTDDERRALGLDRPVGYAIADSDDAQFTAEISGRDDLIVLAPDDARAHNDPYYRFRLAQRLALAPGQGITRTTLHWPGGRRAEDAAVATIERLRQRAADYNRMQNRTRHLLTEQHLEQAVRDASARLWDDARALGENVTIGNGRGWPPEHALRVVIELTPPQDGWVAAADSGIVVAKIPGAADDIQLRVVHTTSADSRTPPDQLMNDAFGYDLDQAPSYSYGDARYSIARLLGHADEEIAFAYTDDDAWHS